MMNSKVHAAVLYLAISTSAVHASTTDPVQQLVDILRDNGSITSEQHAALSQALRQRTPAPAPPPPVLPPQDDQVMVRTEGGFEVSTMDGEFSARLGGTLMFDAAHYFDGANSLGSGTELRRGKLGVEGRMFGNWLYEFDIDFADDKVDVDDAYLSYVGFAPWQLNFGQHKQPFSLEELTSSRNITFMERALPNVLAPGRALGISAAWHTQHAGLAVGAFTESVDNNATEQNNQAWNLVARATYAPIADESRALHFGVAGSHGEPNENGELRFRTEPESHALGFEFLDTGKIKDVVSHQSIGLETAWVHGPFSVQGEWMQTGIDRDAKPTLTFSGWYAQASWFVTGESRNYRPHNGTFGHVEPYADKGAVELAVRVSEMDLNDRDIEGGHEQNVTFGINWYLNDHLRLMANYVLVNNDRFADADGNLNGNDDFDLLQVRLQADF